MSSKRCVYGTRGSPNSSMAASYMRWITPSSSKHVSVLPCCACTRIGRFPVLAAEEQRTSAAAVLNTFMIQIRGSLVSSAEQCTYTQVGLVHQRRLNQPPRAEALHLLVCTNEATYTACLMYLTMLELLEALMHRREHKVLANTSENRLQPPPSFPKRIDCEDQIR